MNFVTYGDPPIKPVKTENKSALLYVYMSTDLTDHFSISHKTNACLINSDKKLKNAMIRTVQYWSTLQFVHTKNTVG